MSGEQEPPRMLTAYGHTLPAADWRRVFCAHEAGHAVAVMVLLRRALSWIEVKSQEAIPANGEPGWVEYHPKPELQSDRHIAASKIVVALAAEHAQAHGFPELVRQVPAVMEALCHHDWERAGEAARFFVDSGLVQFIDPFRGLARRLVVGLWPAVARVAEQVERRHRMTGVEVESIVLGAIRTEEARPFHDELVSLVAGLA